MKRRVYLFVSFVLAGSVLFACGHAENDNESTTLRQGVNSENVESMDSSESSKKQELILAGIGFDDSIVSAVTMFNQSNDEDVIKKIQHRVSDYMSTDAPMP